MQNFCHYIKKYIQLLLAILFCIVLFVIFRQTKLIGATDISKATLAGTTAIIEGQAFPLKQRPPVYSSVLAALANLIGVDTSQKVGIAQESGDIVRLSVANELLERPFLSWVFVVQLGLWLISYWLYCKTLERLSVSNTLIKVSLLLFMAPSAWMMTLQVWEATILQLMFALSLYLCSVWINANNFSMKNFFLIATSASMLGVIGLSRSAFQALPIFLAIIVPWFFLKTSSLRIGLLFSYLLLIFTLIFVGGWGLRNWDLHGFFGNGASLGVSLSTRTATFMEQGMDFSPQYGEIFKRLRDERYLKSESHSPNLWGEDAARYLISEQNMTYTQANKVLISYNLQTILHAPLNYFATALQSMIGFHFPNVPEWPSIIRLPITIMEFLVIALFFVCTSIWSSLHLVSFLKSNLIKLTWNTTDQIIAISLLVYAYAVIIHCGIDQGTSYQRMSVQYFINMVILLVFHRFGLFFKGTGGVVSSNPKSCERG